MHTLVPLHHCLFSNTMPCSGTERDQVFDLQWMGITFQLFDIAMAVTRNFSIYRSRDPSHWCARAPSPDVRSSIIESTVCSLPVCSSVLCCPCVAARSCLMSFVDTSRHGAACMRTFVGRLQPFVGVTGSKRNSGVHLTKAVLSNAVNPFAADTWDDARRV